MRSINHYQDGQERLAALVERLGGFLERTVRRSELAEVLGELSRCALLLDRLPLAAAADEARAFVESSPRAGAGVLRIVAELRKEHSPPAVPPEERTSPEMPDPRVRIAGAISGADPGWRRRTEARIRELPRRPKRSLFASLPAGRDLVVLELRARGGAIGPAMDALRAFEAAGMLCVGPDPARKGDLLLALAAQGRPAPEREGPFETRLRGFVRGDRKARAAERIQAGPATAAAARNGTSAGAAARAEAGPAAVAAAASTRPSKAAPGAPAAKARGVRSRVRYPIGLKLILIIAGVLVASLSGMIFLASYFFREDARVRIEENNHQSAELLGLKTAGDFSAQVAAVRLLLGSAGAAGEPDSGFLREFFQANPAILFIAPPGRPPFLNPEAAADWGFDRFSLEQALAAESRFVEAGATEASAANLSPYLGRPATGLAIPFRSAAGQGSLVLGVDAQPLLSALRARGIGYSFAVDASGKLLLHPDAFELSSPSDLSALPIVALLQRSRTDNGQTLYRDRLGREFLGSFRKTGFAGIGLVSVAPADLAFEAVDRIQRRNLLIMGAVLSIAMLLVYFYSRSITRPVGVLMDAAHRVENGEFALDISASTRDELGALTETFVEMGRGLGEREKIKEAFGKFVNKEIAERAMRHELSLGGERRTAAVFFSDIRGFTAMSESLQPEEVVEFLNEYFTTMVGCVEATGGVVDKFIGDAIMAVWGVPVSTGRDTAAAVDAALAMRGALVGFNRRRSERGKPAVRIGCAVNAGPLLAGQIGSSRRMEYTVIGDTVNFASRLESLTKPFAVDLIVSAGVREELGEAYRFAPLPLVTVKGKTGPQRVYAVLGAAGDAAAPADILALRSFLGLEDPGLDLDAVEEGEEHKYEISGGKPA